MCKKSELNSQVDDKIGESGWFACDIGNSIQIFAILSKKRLTSETYFIRFLGRQYVAHC